MYHLLFASCSPKEAESQAGEAEKQGVRFNFTKTGLVQPITEKALMLNEEKNVKKESKR